MELLVIHPTLDPKQISTALGLRAKFKHRVGDQRVTISGRPLRGVYPDTRWRYSRLHKTKHQWFADKVDALVGRLEQHKAFFKKLRKTGGSACIIVQLLGDGYFGDEISRGTLKRMASLDLDFGLESYLVRQNEGQES